MGGLAGLAIGAGAVRVFGGSTRAFRLSAGVGGGGLARTLARGRRRLRRLACPPGDPPRPGRGAGAAVTADGEGRPRPLRARRPRRPPASLRALRPGGRDRRRGGRAAHRAGRGNATLHRGSVLPVRRQPDGDHPGKVKDPRHAGRVRGDDQPAQRSTTRWRSRGSPEWGRPCRSHSARRGWRPSRADAACTSSARRTACSRRGT